MESLRHLNVDPVILHDFGYRNSQDNSQYTPLLFNEFNYDQHSSYCLDDNIAICDIERFSKKVRLLPLELVKNG